MGRDIVPTGHLRLTAALRTLAAFTRRSRDTSSKCLSKRCGLKLSILKIIHLLLAPALIHEKLRELSINIPFDL